MTVAIAYLDYYLSIWKQHYNTNVGLQNHTEFIAYSRPSRN